MKQPLIKDGDERDEADLEYGSQRKAIMHIKEELSNVHCMITSMVAGIMGWVAGAIAFCAYYTYVQYTSPTKDMVFVVRANVPI